MYRKSTAIYLWEFCYIAGELTLSVVYTQNWVDKDDFVRHIYKLCAILKKNVPRLNLSMKIISNQV